MKHTADKSIHSNKRALKNIRLNFILKKKVASIIKRSQALFKVIHTKKKEKEKTEEWQRHPLFPSGLLSASDKYFGQEAKSPEINERIFNGFYALEQAISALQ